MARISDNLGEWGIDPGAEIVVYADKGSACPYFILATLELVGAENAHVYHGGIDDWTRAGHEVSSTHASLAPRKLDVHPQPGVIVSTDEVRASLTDRTVQILDVRTPKEFKGLDVRALRGGHIPGAVNIPYEQNWVDPDSLIKQAAGQLSNSDGFAMKTPEALKQVYDKLDPSLTTIIYCQSSPRASVTAAVLKDLGFRDVRIYDASWADYGNRFDLPAEDQTFFDIFTMTRRIGVLEDRIKTLETKLDEIRDQRK